MIEDEDFIYLDAGTTTGYMIDALGHTNAVFVTNAVSHAQRLAAKGITKAEGFTTPDANEALVKQTAIERCKNRYVLADYSKFGCISSVTFSAFEQVKILTDGCPAEYQELDCVIEVEERNLI